MDIRPIITHHFVKSEDLNHHGTLFAGRTAEWFIEAGLMAAAVYVPANNIVCARIHGMTFMRPIQLGSVTQILSKVVYTGKSSLIANIRLYVQDTEILNGFITFVNVDENGSPKAHHIKIQAETPEDIALHEEAQKLHVSR
ncbi:MAG: acyl-CoA thioesterase [Lachnospiraceae bacterium]